MKYSRGGGTGWWQEPSVPHGTSDGIGARRWLMVMDKPSLNSRLHQHNFIQRLISVSIPNFLRLNRKARGSHPTMTMLEGQSPTAKKKAIKEPEKRQKRTKKVLFGPLVSEMPRGRASSQGHDAPHTRISTQGWNWDPGCQEYLSWKTKLICEISLPAGLFFFW